MRRGHASGLLTSEYKNDSVFLFWWERILVQYEFPESGLKGGFHENETKRLSPCASCQTTINYLIEFQSDIGSRKFVWLIKYLIDF